MSITYAMAMAIAPRRVDGILHRAIPWAQSWMAFFRTPPEGLMVDCFIMTLLYNNPA